LSSDVRDWRERRDVRETLATVDNPARRARLASLACLAAASLTLAACGYQFRVGGAGPTVGSGSAAPAAEAPRMHIVNFTNMTTEPGLEVKYTTYAQREFAAGSGARLVGSSETADYILKGTINGIALPTINFTLQGTFESRATATVDAKVEEVKTGKTVWNQTVVASAEFFITADLQTNRVLQTRAIEQAGRLIAADLATRFQDFLDRRARGLPLQAVPTSPKPIDGGPPAAK
jgi:hypothetical protein